jgi:hypothetical protein
MSIESRNVPLTLLGAYDAMCLNNRRLLYCFWYCGGDEGIQQLLIISLALLALPLILVLLMEDVDLKEIDRKTERAHQGTSIGTSRADAWIRHFMRRQANR